MCFLAETVRVCANAHSREGRMNGGRAVSVLCHLWAIRPGGTIRMVAMMTLVKGELLPAER
jgi:hypothetical protein